MLYSHCLTTYRLLCIQRRLVQLDFLAAFDRVNHCGLFHKLMSIGVGEHFLFTVSEFLIDRWQRV